MILRKKKQKHNKTNKQHNTHKKHQTKNPKHKPKWAYWQKIFLYTQCTMAFYIKAHSSFPYVQRTVQIFTLSAFSPGSPITCPRPPWPPTKELGHNRLHWPPYFAPKLLNNHFECRDEQKEIKSSFLEFLKINWFLFFNGKWLSGKQEGEDASIWALEIFLRKQIRTEARALHNLH